jgi:hypothetical protein
MLSVKKSHFSHYARRYVGRARKLEPYTYPAVFGSAARENLLHKAMPQVADKISHRVHVVYINNGLLRSKFISCPTDHLEDETLKITRLQGRVWKGF